VAATKEAKYTIFNRIIEELRKLDPSGLKPIKQACTLSCYFKDGLKTAVLCGAGSFYMLILMACSRIRPEIRKLNGPMCGRVVKLIRCPPGEYLLIFLVSFLTSTADTALGRKVTRHIISVVAHLHQLYPISLKLILLLESLRLGHLIDEIDCQDIRSSDDVFDALQYKLSQFSLFSPCC